MEHSLKGIQDVGAVSTTFQVVDHSSLVEISKASKVFQGGGICVDDCTWAATARGVDPTTAQTIYSGNAKGEIGRFNRNKLIFTINILDSDHLTATKQFSFSEEKSMDFSGIENLSEQDLMNQLNGSSASNAFNDATSNSNMTSSEDQIAINQSKGRLVAFITKTNATVKAKIVRPAKKDADGKRIPKEYDPGKIVFASVAPQSPSAVIISRPTADGKTMRTQVVDKNEAGLIVAKEFGGVIKESEAVVARPMGITIKTTVIKTGERAGSKRWDFVLQSKDFGRKTVLTEGNYIPTKEFIVGSPDQNAANNIKALFASGKHTPSELTPEFEAAYNDGDVDVQKLKSLGVFKVPRYDDANLTVGTAIPVRKSKVDKNGQLRYKFEWNTSVPAIVGSSTYKKIVHATGLDPQQLALSISSYGRKLKDASKDFNVDEFIQDMMNGAYDKKPVEA